MTFLSRIFVHEFFTGRNGLPGPSAINDPHAVHCAVMRLFGDGGREAQGVLFRVEPADTRERPAVILIRSNTKPVFVPASLITLEDAPAPAEGLTVSFRIAVNAIRRNLHMNAAGREAFRSLPVTRDDDPAADGTDPMTNWLAAKLSPALSSVEVINHVRTVNNADRKGPRAGAKRIVQTDLLDGFATVTDPAALTALLSSGVGRAKAYGCGLLTVKGL